MFESLSSFPLLFGIAASLAHVFAGPDHLAAIAPIAIYQKRRPWMIGMAWGIGHLVGMMIIGVLFYYLKDLIPIEFISQYSERMVGFLLILIGIWAIYKMFTYRAADSHSHDHVHEDEKGNTFVHAHHHHHGNTKVHTHAHDNSNRQTYLAALGIGVLHGLAGVSHFLGLLPTLAFESKFDSTMYLSGFAIGTVLAMVIFSTVLGLIGEKASLNRKDMLFKTINGIAGISAIFVGVFWMWSTW